MATFRFYGRILPAAFRLTMKDLPSVHWEDKELGLVIDATLSIIDSELLVTCESNLYTTQEDISEIYKRVFDMSNAAVDCFSFIKGMGLTLIIDRMLPPDGVEHNILVQRPDLANLVTSFDLNRENKGNNFDTMYGIMLSDPSVFLAVNDLIASIAASHRAPVNCGRAIETIREVMTPSGGDRKQGWEAMQQKLNIGLAYLKFITDVSTAPRHGKRVGATSQKDFGETINRSWIVMNRFLEFKKRGGQQLPLADFPLL